MRGIKLALAALLLPALVFAVSGMEARADNIVFNVDPTQFYNYVSTFGTNGGQFVVEPTYNQAPSYVSYNSSASTLNSIVGSMGSGQGIGAFSVYFFQPGDPNQATVTAWGQTLTISPTSAINPNTLTAPAGWTSASGVQADGYGNFLQVSYYTSDPSKYARPGNDPGNFAFELDNVAAQAGNNYTLYWSGLNSVSQPAIVWNDPASGTSSNNGSYYIATTGLVAQTPEPGTVALMLAGLGFGLGYSGWQRRRKGPA